MALYKKLTTEHEYVPRKIIFRIVPDWDLKQMAKPVFQWYRHDMIDSSLN